MNIFDYIAEKRIQEAIERGEFKNLPGEGKPLNLMENPFEPPEMRMARNLLENNGFKLPWIEKLIEIREEIEKFRIAFRSAEEMHGGSKTSSVSDGILERAQQINKKIMDYNISVPTEQLQIRYLDLEEFCLDD